MLYSTLLHGLWLSAAVYAQTTAGPSATILNLFDDKTITALSIDDKSVTHYTHHCTPRPANVSMIISSIAADTSDSAAASITAAPRPRVRRDAPDNFQDLTGLCFDYKLLQGPSTWELHLTDQESGVWTIDAACTFGDGGAFSATVSTCTLTNAGALAFNGTTTLTTTETLASTGTAADDTLTAYTVALETGSGFNTPSPSKTSGIAAGIPLPTGGVVAMVGGAVGLYGLL